MTQSDHYFAHVVNTYSCTILILISQTLWVPWKHTADSRFAPSQWETVLLCNDVSHWLGANLESALKYHLKKKPWDVRPVFFVLSLIRWVMSAPMRKYVIYILINTFYHRKAPCQCIQKRVILKQGCVLPIYKIPIRRIRRLHKRVIFIMGILFLEGWYLYRSRMRLCLFEAASSHSLNTTALWGYNNFVWTVNLRAFFKTSDHGWYL